YSRDVIGTGVGQRIDCCLTETSIRILESIITEYSYDGAIRKRIGNGTFVTIPSGHFLTKDNEYLALSVAGDKVFANFAKAIGRADLLQSEEYSTPGGRMRNRDEINKIAGDWIKEHTIDECLAALGDDVPNCKIYTVADILKDPHFKERGIILDVETKKFGKLKMQGIVPMMSDTPGEVKWAGPDIGEYNEEIFCGRLKISKDELSKLKADGVI
ncbi:MAG: CoA transferase, partial [Acidaminococcales bacterium]|nr:CoA transferase [Acidaminococcales bacterium]